MNIMRPIDYLWAIVAGLFLLLLTAATAHGQQYNIQQTITILYSNSAYSSLVNAATCDMTHVEVLIPSNKVLALDSSASAFTFSRVTATGGIGNGALTRATSASGFTLNCDVFGANVSYSGTGTITTNINTITLIADSNYSTCVASQPPGANTAINLNGHMLSYDTATNSIYTHGSLFSSDTTSALTGGYTVFTDSSQTPTLNINGTITAGIGNTVRYTAPGGFPTINVSGNIRTDCGNAIYTSAIAGAITVSCSGSLISTNSGSAIYQSGSCGGTLNLQPTSTIQASTSAAVMWSQTAVTLNMSSGTLTGTQAPLILSSGITFNGSTSGSLTLIGSGAVVCKNAGIPNFNNCTLIGISNQVSDGGAVLTNCTLIARPWMPISGPVTVVSQNANNYVQLTTSAGGTINMPAAATIMGPWKITNNAQGTATQIGPWLVTPTAVGPYPVQ